MNTPSSSGTKKRRRYYNHRALWEELVPEGMYRILSKVCEDYFPTQDCLRVFNLRNDPAYLCILSRGW